MAEEVWVSSVLRNYSFYDKPGIREKLYGEDWAPPTHNLSVIASGEHDRVAHRKAVDAAEESLAGFKHERTAFPEATDTLHDIDGIWFEDASTWRSTDSLIG